MKRCASNTHYLVLVMVCSLTVLGTVTAKEVIHQQHQETTTLDETDKMALEAFSNTVNCMFNIVHDPHSKQTILSNIGAIIGNIFSFVAQMVSHNKSTYTAYEATRHKIHEIIHQQLVAKSAPIQKDITDATAEIETIEQEEEANNININAHIHAMLATINALVNNLYQLTLSHSNASVVSAKINDLLEQTVQIAVNTMKCKYLHGHASEEDFEAYLESLEELQEKIKHTIVTNALHLREERA